MYLAFIVIFTISFITAFEIHCKYRYYLDIINIYQGKIMRKIDRFLQYLEYKGITENKATIECGLAQGLLHQAKSGKSDLGAKTIDKILIKYQDLSREYLLTGEGEMLKPKANETSIINEKSCPVKGYETGVPYYNVDFLGGFDMVLNNQTINPEYLIDFQEYSKATCWCNITGHSMEPEITHGDIIALKEIEDFSFLPYGEIYAIITTTGMRTIKRLGPAKLPGHYALIPTNKAPEYGTQEIPKELIYKVYAVLGCMKKL